MSKKAAIYLRVSTSSQTTENQRLELEKVAELKGLRIAEVYEDKGISGAKGRSSRPALDAMMRDATRRKFDTVLVWSVDRLGRSTAHVATLMTELKQLDVAQYYHKQGVDTSTPYGEAMLEMAAVFAKLEREIIRERVNAGLDRARAEGKTLGRPALSDDTKDKVMEAKEQGLSVRRIAAHVGVSVGAVHKILQAQAG